MVNGELRMVRRPRAALSPFTASPVAIHHSGRLGGGRTASNVPHAPNTKRPARGAFLWERERPARKSAGKMPVCAPDWARGAAAKKTDDCDGCDAGAMNRAPTGCVAAVGARHCALMGYIQGWVENGARQTPCALPHKAPAWGAFYGRAGRGKTKHRFVFRSRKLPVGQRRGEALLCCFRLRPLPEGGLLLAPS